MWEMSGAVDATTRSGTRRGSCTTYCRCARRSIAPEHLPLTPSIVRRAWPVSTPQSLQLSLRMPQSRARVSRSLSLPPSPCVCSTQRQWRHSCVSASASPRHWAATRLWTMPLCARVIFTAVIVGASVRTGRGECKAPGIVGRWRVGGSVDRRRASLSHTWRGGGECRVQLCALAGKGSSWEGAIQAVKVKFSEHRVGKIQF